MIFSPLTLPALLSGCKRQTRRIVGPEESIRYLSRPIIGGRPLISRSYGAIYERPAIVSARPYRRPGEEEEIRIKYVAEPYKVWGDPIYGEIGYKTYAIQPGRGKKAIGRLRIINIGIELVQDITEEDALAEGAPRHLLGTEYRNARDWFWRTWDQIHPVKHRMDQNPMVWIITFRIETLYDEARQYM